MIREHEQPLPTNTHAPLTAAFLVVSFVLSVVILRARNLYDDEIGTLWVVTSPARQIVRHLASQDVHPPGMYLLAHAAWLAIRSYRWMNVLPCLALYAGLATFLFAVVPLLQTMRSRILFLLLATLHPELLLWSNTFRWYSWWTGLALIALTVALQPQKETPVLQWPRAAWLGAMLAALFYLNYITLLFAAALAVAMWFRYREAQPGRSLLACAGLAVAIYTVLAGLQLHTMFAVHLARSVEQHVPLPASAARLTIGLAASEAYLPWHPLALLACLCFGLTCIAAAVQLAGRAGPGRERALIHDPHLRAVAIFAISFFLLMTVAGLGGKPRNGLLLVPVLAAALAAIAGSLQNMTQSALLLIFAFWSGVGVAHMLGRYGLAKATMNDRPEEVVHFVREDKGRGCAAVATYDTGVAFAVGRAGLPDILALSARPGAASGSFLQPLQIGACTSLRLYLVRSYLGGDGEWRRTLDTEFANAALLINGPAHTGEFSRDPDASRKRRLARLPLLGRDLANAADLPDYRFVVISGAIDPGQFAKLQQCLPDFTPLR